MAAVSTAARGLSTEDLESIRDGLAAGRKPRVLFTETAGQVAGQVGHVVELTDPELSEEWVVVRFGKDELPFSPTDLKIPPKGATARRVAAPPQEMPEFKLAQPPTPEVREEQKMPAKSASVSPVVAKPAPVKPAAASSAAAPPAKRDTPSAAPAPTSGSVPAPRKAGRSGKAKSPAGLTVILAYTDGEWTVAANQGSKAVAKPYVIKPADALKMVGLLDVPAVQEAVDHIVAAERAEAEQQAEKLRAELADIEARLADLRDAT